MQISQSYCYLSYHKASLVLRESSHLHNMSEQFPSFHEIHNEENSKLIAEHIIHTHKERMLKIIKNLHLRSKGILIQ